MSRIRLRGGLETPVLYKNASRPNKKKSGLRGAYNVDPEKVPVEQPEHHQESYRGQFKHIASKPGRQRPSFCPHPAARKRQGERPRKCPRECTGQRARECPHQVPDQSVSPALRASSSQRVNSQELALSLLGSNPPC